ncbi:MAG TPA: ATP-dependent RecD-like DNA helicase, partial [Candidatus Hydrogenedentes bacterium]|nr:ATP-dependent RecD-like DNA helicase [Candidatus Hydrogenedentota bacterium]
MTPPWTRDDLFPNGRKPGGGAPDAPGQTDLERTDTVEGVVERIVYENPENGFFVGRLRRDDTRELETFVGNLMAVSPGETVRLTGRWEVDRKFGRELRVTAYETVLPSTAEGIERFLGSGMIAGVGKEMAKRLVAAFGRETLRVIAEQPERLRG